MINNLPNLGSAVREKGIQPSSPLKAKAKNGEASKSEPSFQEMMKSAPETRSTQKTEVPRKSQEDERFVKSSQFGRKEEISESVVETPNSGELQRKIAILKFMDSMESELGVPPEEIAEAMANLKPADLLRPPEESALQVVENLDLNEVDQERALALYAGLLSQIDGIQKNNVIDPKQSQSDGIGAAEMFGAAALATTGKQIVSPQGQDLKAVSEISAKDRRVNLNSSLEKLANKFFRQGEAALDGADPMMAQMQAIKPEAYQGKVPVEAGGKALANPELSSIDALNGELEVDLSKELATEPLRMEGPQFKKNGDQQMPKAGEPFFFDRETLMRMEAQKFAAVPAAAMALKSYQEAQDLTLPASVPLEAAPIPEAAEGNLDGLVKALETLNAKAEALGMPSSTSAQLSEQSTDDSGSDLGSQSGADTNQFFPQMNEKTASFGAALGAASQVPTQGGGKPTSAVGDLVSQAQLIATKGGGEAIVKLNPEGLGEVKLKVAVKNGSVQINMAAETAEAKKLLESSVGDLREALSQQKLSIDSIKVDVGTQLGQDKQNPERGMGFQQDPGREQARNFFNQFREENLARREPFVEAPSVKSYRKPTDPLGPSTSVNTAQRYSGEGRGARMNLVA